jgi:hypothetical protein
VSDPWRSESKTMRQLRLLMTFALTGVMMLMMSGISAADVIINHSTTAPTFGPDERAVTLLNGDTGTTVHGSIDNPSTGVLFSSVGDILFNGAINGVSAVRAQDGSINNLIISLPGSTFTDAIFDVYGVYLTNPAFTITVNLNDGSITENLTLTAGQTSRNWFSLQTTNNETISSIEFSGAKFYGLESTNISGTQSAVPEPSTIALVFSGLLGAGVKVRRIRKTKKETV